MTTAFSGAPLAEQLSLRDGQRVWFEGMPEDVFDEIAEYALDLTFVDNPAQGIDAAHIFVTERAELAERLAALRQQIARDGQVWVSWPSQASTDLTEDAIRELALPLGFIDTKSCEVNATWSALKLVIRKDLR